MGASPIPSVTLAEIWRVETGVQSWAQVGGQAQLPLGKEVLLGIPRTRV